MTDRKILTAYPLTPLQEGMLYHELRDSQSGVYLIQYRCLLRGELHEDDFGEAWRQTVQNHASLRTSFNWETRERPLQVVGESAVVEIEHQDWQEGDATARAERWEAWLAQDRERGFDLRVAPMTRLALFRTDASEWHFLWTAHHIVLEGWSIRLAMREVLERYAALRSNQSYRPKQAAEFSQYVTWLESHDPETTEQFWRDSLAGVDAPTALPDPIWNPGHAFDSPRAVPSRSTIHHHRALSPQLTEKLESTCRRLRITLNTLVTAAWALFLHRHVSSGKDQTLAPGPARRDVVFGISVIHRPPEIEGIEETIGLLLNTIPLRVEVPYEETVARWLPTLQSEIARLRQYDHASLAQVQRWSDLPNGVALCESVLTFESFTKDDAMTHAGGLRVEEESVRDRSHFALSLLAYPGDSLNLEFIDGGERYSDADASGFLDRLESIFEEFAKRPDARVGELEWWPAAEQQRVLQEWSRSEEPAPKAFDLLDLISERSQAQPDRPALSDGVASMTYRELDRYSTNLATMLREQGLGPGSFAVLQLARHPRLIVSLLAILKCGAAYVPVALDAPKARLRTILRALRKAADGADPFWIIESESPQDEITDEACRKYLLGDLQALPDAKNPEMLPAPVDPSAPAYVIYTSGSTGEPKGVVVERGQLAYSTAARLAYYASQKSGSVDRFLMLSSPAVDSSIAGIYWTLCSGGTLVLPPERAEQSIDGIAELVQRESISHLLALPSLYRLLLENASAECLGSIRCAVVAGENCPAALVDIHHSTLTAELFNEYGPSESTVWATVARLGAGSVSVSIGRPIPGTQVFVLGARRELLPQGMAGEIYIGGPGLARGYLGRPELTTERFVESSIHTRASAETKPIERLYRTGDRGRWRADGQLEFLGRIDRQVKIRGFRVELDEIERTIEDHPAISSAIVIVDGGTEASDADRLIAVLEALPDTQAHALLCAVEADEGSRRSVR